MRGERWDSKGFRGKRAGVARTQRGARCGSRTLVKRAGPDGDTWIAKWRDGVTAFRRLQERH